MRNVDLEEATEGTMDREKNKCVYTTKDRTAKRKYVTERESEETEDEVLQICDASRWSEEGDDAGTWERKRKRGRPRRRWMEEIHEATGMKLEHLREATRDRETWRALLTMIARTHRVDGTR